MFRDTYARFLRAMKEPALAPGFADRTTACRFLWLRSFDNPISVRVEPSGSELLVRAVVLDGDCCVNESGEVDPGEPIERMERRVQASWEGLSARLASDAVWQPRGWTEYEYFNMDGAAWVLEYRDGDTYRVVHRSSPIAAGPYSALRSICTDMLEWTGLPVQTGY